jgi:hypothetical protein
VQEVAEKEEAERTLKSGFVQHFKDHDLKEEDKRKLDRLKGMLSLMYSHVDIYRDFEGPSGSMLDENQLNFFETFIANHHPLLTGSDAKIISRNIATEVFEVMQCDSKEAGRLDFFSLFSRICDYKAEECFEKAHELEEAQKQSTQEKGERYDRLVLAESTKAVKWLSKKEICQEEKSHLQVKAKKAKKADTTHRSDVLHSFWNKEKLNL